MGTYLRVEHFYFTLEFLFERLQCGKYEIGADANVIAYFNIVFFKTGSSAEVADDILWRKAPAILSGISKPCIKSLCHFSTSSNVGRERLRASSLAYARMRAQFSSS